MKMSYCLLSVYCRNVVWAYADEMLYGLMLGLLWKRYGLMLGFSIDI